MYPFISFFFLMISALRKVLLDKHVYTCRWNPPLPANLYGREFFVGDHLADLLARCFEQGSRLFDGQDFVVPHAHGSFLESDCGKVRG